MALVGWVEKFRELSSSNFWNLFLCVGLQRAFTWRGNRLLLYFLFLWFFRLTLLSMLLLALSTNFGYLFLNSHLWNCRRNERGSDGCFIYNFYFGLRMLKWSLIGFWIYRHIKIVINHWSFMSEAILTIYLKSTFEIFHQRMIIVIIIVISGSFTDVSFFFSLDAGLVCHDQFFHLLYLSFNIKPFIFYFYWYFNFLLLLLWLLRLLNLYLHFFYLNFFYISIIENFDYR